MKRLLLLSAVLPAFLLNAEEYYNLPPVKLIHDGWGFQYQPLAPGEKPSRQMRASTAALRKNIRMMEKAIPGSGIVIRFIVPPRNCGNRRIDVSAVFGGEKLEYGFFKEDIENLRRTEFRKFTDNFLGLTVSPGKVDWFDDASWKTVCRNHEIVSRVAKECGLKGLKLDIEEYGANTMWRFKPERGRSLDETVKKVRQRGQEFGRALFGAFPDMHLLCYWWLSLVRTKNDLFNMDRAEYMVAPFVNGMYDVMPETVTVHEGDESCAYRANNEAEFYHLSIDLRKTFLRALDPKHLRKYRAQTMLAPGLYVDPHFSAKAGFWSNQLKPDLKKLGGAALLKRSLAQAMETADMYVWMWHERFVWFPSHHPAQPQVISDIAPHLAEEMDLLLKPLPRAAQLVAERKLPNLVKNGDFSEAGKGKRTFAAFGEWHGSGDKGTFRRQTVDGNGAAVAAGVSNGCIMQDIKVRPGQMYLVRCRAWNLDPKSRARAKLTVNWKMPGGERFADYLNRGYYFRRLGPDADRTQFTVVVPEGAAVLELMLGADKGGKGDEIFFDDLELYKIVD
ncbi:MAG: hypothetical protein IJU70_10585 [Lentisphaeria bacterium]|nr:hypothetical protein [Lentisphaeria bacterium]